MDEQNKLSTHCDYCTCCNEDVEFLLRIVFIDDRSGLNFQVEEFLLLIYF